MMLAKIRELATENTPAASKMSPKPITISTAKAAPGIVQRLQHAGTS
jgi:hypothetical protein